MCLWHHYHHHHQQRQQWRKTTAQDSPTQLHNAPTAEHQDVYNPYTVRMHATSACMNGMHMNYWDWHVSNTEIRGVVKICAALPTGYPGDCKTTSTTSHLLPHSSQCTHLLTRSNQSTHLLTHASQDTHLLPRAPAADASRAAAARPRRTRPDGSESSPAAIAAAGGDAAAAAPSSSLSLLGKPRA